MFSVAFLFVGLSVCMSVSDITQKRYERIAMTFMELSGVVKGTRNYILVVIWTRSDVGRGLRGPIAWNKITVCGYLVLKEHHWMTM